MSSPRVLGVVSVGTWVLLECLGWLVLLNLLLFNLVFHYFSFCFGLFLSLLFVFCFCSHSIVSLSFFLRLLINYLIASHFSGRYNNKKDELKIDNGEINRAFLQFCVEYTLTLFSDNVLILYVFSRKKQPLITGMLFLNSIIKWYNDSLFATFVIIC